MIDNLGLFQQQTKYVTLSKWRLRKRKIFAKRNYAAGNKERILTRDAFDSGIYNRQFSYE